MRDFDIDRWCRHEEGAHKGRPYKGLGGNRNCVSIIIDALKAAHKEHATVIC